MCRLAPSGRSLSSEVLWTRASLPAPQLFGNSSVIFMKRNLRSLMNASQSDATTLTKNFESLCERTH